MGTAMMSRISTDLCGIILLNTCWVITGQMLICSIFIDAMVQQFNGIIN
jgi:hypothetical protein